MNYYKYERGGQLTEARDGRGEATRGESGFQSSCEDRRAIASCPATVSTRGRRDTHPEDLGTSLG
jgi:hypothetical protein